VFKLRDGVFVVVFSVSHDQTAGGQDGEPMFVLLSVAYQIIVY